jgi:hypothetical protein
MTQETITRNATEMQLIEDKRNENKTANLPQLLNSLRSIGDDIGQISELSSEEKLLVAQFFGSLLKLMKPLSPAISVTSTIKPFEREGVTQAFVDPKGHLSISHEDGRQEIKDLADEANRDLMVAVVEDIMPKFKELTSGEKHKIESRITFMTAVTKELQKISDTFCAAIPPSSE